MRSRLARLGAIAGAILGLLGVMTPPAHANYVGSIAFVGAATVTDGLGYPCFPNTSNSGMPTLLGTPPVFPNAALTVNNHECPQGLPKTNATIATSHQSTTIVNPVDGTLITFSTPTTTTATTALPSDGLPLASTTTLPLPNNPIPNTSTRVHGGRTKSFGFSSAVCLGAGVNTLKPGKPLLGEVDASCSIVANGTVNGWCGLSQAQGVATVTFGGQTYTVVFHFTGIGGTLIVDGHVRKNNIPNHTSLVVGVVEAVPLPGTTGGPTITNSCSSGTAVTFQIAGTASFVIINTLP